MSGKRLSLMESVGRRVAELRLKHGWTQDYLADKVGVTGGYIRKIEGGNQNLTLASLERIATILECDPIKFFEKPKLMKGGPGRPRS